MPPIGLMVVVAQWHNQEMLLLPLHHHPVKALLKTRFLLPFEID